jgi:hypothetical protein
METALISNILGSLLIKMWCWFGIWEKCDPRESHVSVATIRLLDSDPKHTIESTAVSTGGMFKYKGSACLKQALGWAHIYIH